MDLNSLRSPKVLIGVLVGLAVLVGAFLVLRGGDEGEPDEVAAPKAAQVTTTEPCELWTPDELQEWLGGSTWEKDEDLSAGSTCAYREVDGPGTVSVLLNEAPTQVLFDSFRSGREAAPLDGLGDEAWWWEDTARPGGGLVMRVGGRVASIDLAGQFPDRLAYAAVDKIPPGPDYVPEAEEAAEEEPAESEEEPIPALNAQETSVEIHRRLVALGTAVGERLEPAPFEEGSPTETPGVSPGAVTVGESVCDTLSLDALSADMQVSSEGAALSPLGERGCSFTNAESVSVTVELVAKGADESALQVGREMTSDGETLVWTPEPVDDVGDGAVWMIDPSSGTTGELNALFDGALVRVTSTGTEADGLKARAVAAARLAGPEVAKLDLPESGEGD